MYWLRYVIVIIVAYLIGNFSTGLIVSRSMAQMDIRKFGSGNAGATNMLRTLGWLPSVITLLGDVLKAVIAALIGKFIAGEYGMLIAGLAAIIGHNWPVLYDFKGGKGIAASLGAIIVVSPLIGAILFVFEVIVVAITKYMSVASICSAILYPILAATIFPGDTPKLLAALAVCALAIFSHRANIVRLIKGNENKLDFGKISKISKKREGKK